MRVATIIATIVVTAANGMAWGPAGHMIVAAVAWSKLTPQVRKEVARLLKENPDYATWTSGVAAADRDAIAFIRAATWPDDIKSNKNYDNSEGEHPKLGAQSGQNIGYDDMLQHRYWHFYDKPFQADSTPTKGPDAVNALTQIKLFTSAIHTSNDDSIKSYDIVWLIHMVGDVHQPLHATSRFDKDDLNGDEGGNRVHLCTAAQMKMKAKCRSELHGFWDETPGPNNGPEAARITAGKLDPPDAVAVKDNKPEDWIDESFKAAKESAYTDPIQLGDGPFVLTTEYREHAEDLAHERLALAGARLANLLNANLMTMH